LLRHLSRTDFEKTVKDRQTDKGARTLSTFDFFKQMVYGQISGCFSVREIENYSSRLYHAGLLPLKRSTFCDAMEKRDRHVFEDVFHAAGGVHTGIKAHLGGSRAALREAVCGHDTGHD
jgi:hypothetical protein